MSPLSLFVVCWCCIVGALGSNPILFSARPSNVTTVLTEFLNLRCSLNHSGLVVSSSNTVQEVDRVVSIIISKTTANESLALASVTSFDSPVLYAKEQRLAVKGGLISCNSSVHEDEAFLELTWTFPSIDNSGSYLCEMSILSPSHHQTTHYSALEVMVIKPSFGQLVEVIVAVKMASSHLQTKVFKLQEQLQNTRNQLAVISQQPRMRSESGHAHLEIESRQNSRRSSIYDTSMFGKVTFTKAFLHVPQTLLSIASMNSNAAQETIKLEVVNATVVGFNIKARITNQYLNSMEVTWLSIGI